MVGERVMDMSYGCNLEEMVFEPLDTSVITYLKSKITKAVLFYEARIEIEKIEINTTGILEGVLLIEIDYIISATNSRFKLRISVLAAGRTELSSLLKI